MRTPNAQSLVCLEFASRLRELIEKAGKYRVAMTRTDDTFVALADRVAFARGQQAALLISIHADALPKGEGDAHNSVSQACASDRDVRRSPGVRSGEFPGRHEGGMRRSFVALLRRPGPECERRERRRRRRSGCALKRRASRSRSKTPNSTPIAPTS